MTPPVESLRTALVIPNLNGGGAERAALVLAAGTRTRCTVIAERRDGDLLDDPLARDVLFASETGPRPGRAARVARLRRALAAVAPDLVVALLSPLVVATASRSLRIPAVYWLQNPLSEYVPTDASGRPGFAGRMMVRALAGPARAIVGATPGLSEEWAAAGVSPRKLGVLPNGVPLARHAPAPAVASSVGTVGTVEIVSIGRLAAQKRHDILIAAFARLAERVPARLTILGRGALRGDLEQQAARLGVADRVRFTGFVADPGPFLAAADLFVLASDFEGFGNVLVEALSHGLPIVATDVPFGPRFILDGVSSARLVAPGDPPALELAMSAALAAAHDPDAAPQAARARERAQAFGIERTARHFDQLAVAVRERGPLPVWSVA